MPVTSKTEDVLRAVADSLVALDDQQLQQEVNAFQLLNQELARQMQELQFAFQLRQVDIQRQQERAQLQQQNVTPPAPNSALKAQVVTAVETIRLAALQVDDAQWQEAINALNVEQGELNRKMQERQYALNLKQMLAQRATGVGSGSVGLPGLGDTAPDIEDKRRAILDVLRQQPNARWTPARVRAVLVERGFSDPDAGTPIRNLMWRMEKEGLLERPRSGVYALATANPATDDPEGDSED